MVTIPVKILEKAVTTTMEVSGNIIDSEVDVVTLGSDEDELSELIKRDKLFPTITSIEWNYFTSFFFFLLRTSHVKGSSTLS